MTRHARRRRHPAVFIGACLLVVLAVDLAVGVLAEFLHLAVFLVLPAVVGLVAYRVGRRRALPAPRVMQGAVLPPLAVQGADPAALTAEVTRLQREISAMQGESATLINGLEAQRDDLLQQVAKLEADAAEHDDIVTELEHAAGRPIEAVLASYRKIAGMYGTGTRP
jgi:hypothetical protein